MNEGIVVVCREEEHCAGVGYCRSPWLKCRPKDMLVLDRAVRAGIRKQAVEDEHMLDSARRRVAERRLVKP